MCTMTQTRLIQHSSLLTELPKISSAVSLYEEEDLQYQSRPLYSIKSDEDNKRRETRKSSERQAKKARRNRNPVPRLGCGGVVCVNAAGGNINNMKKKEKKETPNNDCGISRQG